MIGAITAGLFAAGVTPATNSYESIATVTVGGGGSSSISFTSIPSTFKHLQIRAITKSTNTDADSQGLLANFNSDSGSNYSYHRLTGNGSAASAGAGTSQTAITVGGILRSSANASMFSTFVMDILDYQNTSKNKTTRQLLGWDTNNTTTGSAGLWSGAWYSTSAINQIVFTIASSEQFATNTHFALYGIKG